MLKVIENETIYIYFVSSGFKKDEFFVSAHKGYKTRNSYDVGKGLIVNCLKNFFISAISTRYARNLVRVVKTNVHFCAKYTATVCIYRTESLIGQLENFRRAIVLQH